MATSFQQLTWPPINATSSSPSTGPSNSPVPSQATLVAGDSPSGILRNVGVTEAGYIITTPDPAGQTHVIVDSSALPLGASTEATSASLLTLITQRLAGSLTPLQYDEVALTYVPTGNGAGQIETVTYSLASSTVKVLTLSYDIQNRLIGVV